MLASRSEDDLRVWFAAADVDGDGKLSVSEFFMWSLSNAVTLYGSKAILELFQKHDKELMGSLDILAFKRLSKELGFGAVTAPIRRSLMAHFGATSPREHTLDFPAVIDSLPFQQRSTCSCDAKTLLPELVRAYQDATLAATNVLKQRRWALKGKDAHSLRVELRDAMSQVNGHVGDLIKLFDEDSGPELQIDEHEFFNAMFYRFGYKGREAVRTHSGMRSPYVPANEPNLCRHHHRWLGSLSAPSSACLTSRATKRLASTSCSSLCGGSGTRWTDVTKRTPQPCLSNRQKACLSTTSIGTWKLSGDCAERCMCVATWMLPR